MNNFLQWFNDRNFLSVHAFTLYITLWMTWAAFHWAGEFAMSTDKTGADVALIIAAVTAPITYLQTKAFEIYSASRK